MTAPAIAVASCGQLIISNTFLAVPFSTELAKIVPTDKIKTYFIIAAGIAPAQKFFLPNLEKVKTNKVFPIIMNGIIGAKANGKSPVYIEIRLGIKHKRKADSKPNVDAEINNSALTINPVIS